MELPFGIAQARPGVTSSERSSSGQPIFCQRKQYTLHMDVYTFTMPFLPYLKQHRREESVPKEPHDTLRHYTKVSWDSRWKASWESTKEIFCYCADGLGRDGWDGSSACAFLMERACLCVLIYEFTYWRAQLFNTIWKLLKRTQTKATLATALPLLGSVCAHCKFPHTLKLNDFLETFHSEDLQINTNKVSSVKITFLLEPKINFLLRERNDTP